MDPIKLYAEHVIEKSQLTTSDKIYLQNRLQKGTLHETMAFLNKGQMLNESVELNEEFNKKIEEDFWANERLQESINEYIIQEGVAKTLLGLILLTPPGWVLWRLAKSTFSSAQRKCGVFSIGRQRDACLLRARFVKMETQKKALLRNDCKNAKDPVKCKKQVEKKLDKLDEKMRFYSGRIEDLKN